MIRAIENIRHSGTDYTVGQVIDGLGETYEARLVKLGAAVYVISPEEEIKQQAPDELMIHLSDEEYQERYKTLDELYNAEELKKAAKDAEVDLTGVTTKPKVIETIIKQNKYDLLVEDESDGEGNE